ncbi:hypothetical protein LTR37_001174 [Vermiconidia calcicola]|uniref:Uncharacterized protein n=1 Tax=Vermiconidia calcicola TaxID=1690605 RepID=A0ACC3NWS3_9PEZI|nr:hypothetical protein LTR37_001174 [Vermiconidia calcicola]
MAPTSGGQYHWVSEFSPRWCQRFLSYTVGWLGVLGWQVGVAFASYLSATEIQGLAILNYPSYVPKNWHGTLIQVCLLIICVFVNTFLAQRLHHVEGLALILHVCGFFAIMIPLWVLSPTAKSRDVWTTFF